MTYVENSSQRCGWRSSRVQNYIPYSTLSSPPPLCLVPPPVSLGKSWSFTILLKNFILKNLELEITSKKIFLIFLFIMYDTAIIKLLFWKIFLINLLFFKLSMKLARAISSSSSSVKSDHLESIESSSL